MTENPVVHVCVSIFKHEIVNIGNRATNLRNDFTNILLAIFLLKTKNIYETYIEILYIYQ